MKLTFPVASVFKLGKKKAVSERFFLAFTWVKASKDFLVVMIITPFAALLP
ncbi:hypothetical protein D3C72_2584010 [compost metagenome]